MFAGDYSHACGSNRIQKKERGLALDSDYPWRTGMFAVVRKALTDENWLGLVERVAHTSRHMPWPLFHAIWEQLLTALEQAGEVNAVQKLVTHYVHLTGAGQYRAHWGAGSLQPGSYCGSQPQAL